MFTAPLPRHALHLAIVDLGNRSSSPVMNAVSVAIKSFGLRFTSDMHVSRKCWRSESLRGDPLRRGCVIAELCNDCAERS